jgi:hypothetical protein
MATRAFYDLVNRIAPSAPGCPQPVIISYVRSAAIDACERSGAWRYKHATVTMVAGTYEYAFVPEADAEVYSILTANINGNALAPTTLDAIHNMYPRFILQISPITFHVALVPDNSTDTVEMFVSQRPTKTAAGMNEAVMNDLEDAIVHGTLQRLLTLPERTWSDNELAAYHAKQYIFRVNERRARTNISAARAAPTVRHSAWA